MVGGPWWKSQETQVQGLEPRLAPAGPQRMLVKKHVNRGMIPILALPLIYWGRSLHFTGPSFLTVKSDSYGTRRPLCTLKFYFSAFCTLFSTAPHLEAFSSSFRT